MEQLKEFLPPGEKGFLPYYLLLVSVVAIGNVVQGFTTLHYTRRIYDGRFVPNASQPPASATFNPEDSVSKIVPAPSPPAGKDDAAKAKDQVSPLAARMFGIYTCMAGLVRFYACYRLEDPFFYQLAIWTHVIAAAHFTSEILVFKTIKMTGPELFPLFAGYGGAIWMVLQYNHYVA